MGIIGNFLKKKKFTRGDINNNDRIGILHKAWGHIFTNHIFGDYIEFGVYKGESLENSIIQYKEFMIWLNNQKKSDENWRVDLASKSPLNQKINFRGIDTFEGIPTNNEKNFTFKKGYFSTSFEKVKKKLSKHSENVILYKGTFFDKKEEIINDLKNKKISICMIDCCLSQSTSDALEIIDNFLTIGTIIIFDDFNCFNADNNKGQRKAFNLYRKQTNWVFEKLNSYQYVGQSFVVVDKLK